jgi:AcrR family transcriptional regulator
MGGTMDAVHSFVAALRKTLDDKPYNKITVQDLCDRAGLSRRTFYKHFEDKDAVARAMVHEDYIEPPLSMRSIMDLDKITSAWLLMTEQTYKTIYENRTRYLNLLANFGKLKLLEIIVDENYQFSKNVFANYDYDELEMDYAAYVMATVSAMTTIRGIEHVCDVPHTKMAQLYGTWIGAHWRELGFPRISEAV